MLSSSSNRCEKIVKRCFPQYYATSDIYRIKNEFVSIYRAPEPEDVIWENCNTSTQQLFIRTFIFFGLSVFILIIGLSLQFGIAKARSIALNPEDFFYQLLWGIGEGIIIMFLNDIINRFLAGFAEY